MARKDPTAHLRAQSRGINRSTDHRDKDNLNAVIDYMIGHSAELADYVERVGRRNVDITPIVDCLPWNEAAPKRVVSLCWSEKTAGHHVFGKRRSRWVDGETSYHTVTIPHWDYDGVDPLVAREPWEREQADAYVTMQVSHAESRRHWDVTHSISNEADAREMQDCIELFGSYRGQYQEAA